MRDMPVHRLLPGSDETRRVDSIGRLCVLNTPAEERFERIIRVAQRLFTVPISFISLLDDARVWLKASLGLAALEWPRAGSFCECVDQANGAVVVGDARTDSRFASNPLVVYEPHIRFYAGYPLRVADGTKVGTLAVADVRPRELYAGDVQMLGDLAFWAEHELQVVQISRAQLDLVTEGNRLRRQALVDPLTRLWNRRAIVRVLARELAYLRQSGSYLSVIMADVDLFKQVNDHHGHPAGDRVLRETARRMRASCRPQDAVGRLGGDEFLLVLPECDAQGAFEVAERIRMSAAGEAMRISDGVIHVTLSLGVTTIDRSTLAHTGSMIDAADRALYAAKAKGRNVIERSQPHPLPSPISIRPSVLPQLVHRFVPASGDG